MHLVCVVYAHPMIQSILTHASLRAHRRTHAQIMSKNCTINMARRPSRGHRFHGAAPSLSTITIVAAAASSALALFPGVQAFLLPGSPTTSSPSASAPVLRTRALRCEGIEWTPCGVPDFYAFADRLTAPSARWEGEVRAWRPAGGSEIHSLGIVRVGVEEVMRACGGAVAGVKEDVASGAAVSEEVYGLCEHNRGDDGFLFAENGAFSHAPEVIPPPDTADGAWQVVTSLVHASHPKTRLRVRLQLRGAAPVALTCISWSWEVLGEVVTVSAGCEEGGISVGRALRAKRGAGPTAQFLRARASWQEAEGAKYDVGAVLDDPNNTASHLTRDHGLLLRIGAPIEDGSGAIRLDVGGLFPAVDGSSRRRSVALWSRVYDADGGNLREAALFESSSSEA